MIVLCTNKPIPSFDEIYTDLKNRFPKSSKLHVPTLPTLPSPIFGSIKHTSLEMCNIASELVMHQLLTTIYNIISPIMSVLNMASSMIPKIPILGLNLLDLITPNPSKLYKSLRQSLVKFGDNLWDMLGVPSYSHLKIPDIQIVHAAKMVVRQYFAILISFVTNIINQVINRFELSSLPTIPTIPTVNEIIKMLINMVPQTKPSKLDNLIKQGTDIYNLIKNFNLPGFNINTNSPKPLILKFKSFEIEFYEMVCNLYQKIITYPLTIIMNFVDSVLKNVLSFSFPTLCITI
jgi:hypothetical protein